MIYKILCKDCDASHVGQTGRKLVTRNSEHQNHIDSSNRNHSAITELRLDFNHEFKWENIQILNGEISQ